jgi:hypothetical protein
LEGSTLLGLRTISVIASPVVANRSSPSKKRSPFSLAGLGIFCCLQQLQIGIAHAVRPAEIQPAGGSKGYHGQLVDGDAEPEMLFESNGSRQQLEEAMGRQRQRTDTAMASIVDSGLHHAYTPASASTSTSTSATTTTTAAEWHVFLGLVR